MARAPDSCAVFEMFTTKKSIDLSRSLHYFVSQSSGLKHLIREQTVELREALQQISDIRQQMARSEVFRGYRSLTVGFSGVLGLLAAAFQSQWVASPAAGSTA